jgi:ribosomal protein L37E
MRLSSPLLRSRAEFIEVAKQKHNIKFVYSKVEYINTDTNVNIICNKHNNIFVQTPGTHLQSKIGCPQCVLEDSSKRYSLPFEEFKRRSMKKYGDQFIYYPETFTRIHGPTKLTHQVCNNTFILNDAYSHLIAKTGCKQCGIALSSKARKDSVKTIEFKKATIINKFNIKNNQNFSLRQLQQKSYLKQKTESNKIKIEQKKECWYDNLIKKSQLIHGQNTFTYKNYGKSKKNRLHLICNKCNKDLLQKVYDHINLKRGCFDCKSHNIKELHAQPNSTQTRK